MSYFKVLGLDKEPFSTSPDPAFLFLSHGHRAALCRLQITVRLRRGMSVILGDVGTGKTTLSRRFAQVLGNDPRSRLYMILNPFFRTEDQFLAKLCSLFRIDVPAGASGLDHMEAVERFLFRAGVEEQSCLVLLIDEAQMLPDFVLEILRILLNYETNEYKILQLVLVGQMELLPRISHISNFWDRIALKYVLNPLGEEEVRELIDFRLRQAGYRDHRPLFTPRAIRQIYEHTQGYPRKLSLLCHNSLESLVMYDKKVVDEDVVAGVIAAEVQPVLDEATLAPPLFDGPHEGPAPTNGECGVGLLVVF